MRVVIQSPGGERQRQAGLADAAGTTQRQQAAGRVVEQRRDLGQIGRPTDEWRGWMRQSRRGSQRAERRKLGGKPWRDYLEDRLGTRDIFELAGAKIAQCDTGR